MTARTITLYLPERLYQRLKARADQAQRSIEDVVLDVLAASLVVADELPEDLAAASAARSPHLYSLRGTPVTYVDPTEPIVASDWDAGARSCDSRS